MTEGQVYPREIERSAHPGAPGKLCCFKASDNERLDLVSRDVGLVYRLGKIKDDCGEHSTGRRRGAVAGNQGQAGLVRFDAWKSLQLPHHRPESREENNEQLRSPEAERKRLKSQKSNFAALPGGGQMSWADACGKIGHIGH
ncbi:uncharacterized protein TrAtP1_008628 [Trichoderma atroviride]|uniref:uncharacterized protein n=1 Tax=Hypocrea atroviridis TaxID=63577 RepID=UPI00332D7007|nr:hypothetical protein TrAtP1_008628 [Trichoderma atroviride]